MNKSINFRIQSLRGISFMLIFISHCCLVADELGNNVFMWWGAFGVELFIVLSGYLAFKYFPKNTSILAYYKRKIKRFLPLHWFTLLVSIPLCLPITLKKLCKIGINATLLQVWFPKSSIYFSMNAVSWYLGISVFFILLTPFLVSKLQNITIKTGIISLSVIQLIEALIVIVSGHVTIDSHWLTYVFPVSRSLDYMGGVFSI